MASPASAPPSRAARSFAGLLEEYASPQAKFPPARAMDGLEDDIATLTYEHALRAHSRYRRGPEPQLPSVPARAAVPGLPIFEAVPATGEPAAVLSRPSPASRKSAWIAVRLTADENKRLRARAAEAGLTNSEFLRSCVFEVESLRAEVKEAVARMRQAEPCHPPMRRNWLFRLFRGSPQRG